MPQRNFVTTLTSLLFAFMLAMTACTTAPGTTPTDTTAPATPTGLQATAGDASAQLSWTANAEADLDHYDVYWGTGSGGATEFLAQVPAGTEVHAATGLANGTTYVFAVDATDASGNVSGRTAEVSATPAPAADVDAPATPTGLAVTSADESLVLAWTANAEADLAHYSIHMGTSPGALAEIAQVPVGTETYTATGLSNGANYYLALTAVDASGNESPPTPEIMARPQPPFLIYGEPMAIEEQRIRVIQNGIGVETATVTVNGFDIPHLATGLYVGSLPAPLAPGDPVELAVSIDATTITATDVVPDAPTTTAPADGATVASADPLTVAWTSASDPDRFAIEVAEDPATPSCSVGVGLPGSFRSYTFPANALAGCTNPKITVRAYNEGTWVGTYTTGSTMDLLMPPNTTPTITVTP